MKLKKIKSKSDKWIVSKLRYFGEREAYWEHFYKFECQPNFKGYTLAKLNEEIYDKEIKYIKRKIRQLNLLRRKEKN